MALFGKSAVSDVRAVEELLTRGVEKVIPFDLARKKLSSGESIHMYLGIDPTGTKLHLGHSVVLRKLQKFCDFGHHVTFLVGSFTAMIGDPSGKDAMREPLTKEQVEENFQTYKEQAKKLLDFSRIEVRYNHQWLEKLSLSEIVKLASTFTVQQMLQRDMFDKRLKEGKPVGLHEFLYPLMVGYDSVILDVDGEIGGSDQEFNMLAGRQLQKAVNNKEKFVLTTRLIEGTDGRKMSKTYNNCIYLEDSPREMFGKIMSVKDELVSVYFETCTDVPMDEVATICEGHPKEAKMRLGREIVSLYHGKEAAQKASEEFTSSFTAGGVPENAPEVKLHRGALLHEALEKIVESKTEMKRLTAAGAIEEVGRKTFTDINQPLLHSMVLRIGKHRFLKVVIT